MFLPSFQIVLDKSPPLILNPFKSVYGVVAAPAPPTSKPTVGSVVPIPTNPVDLSMVKAEAPAESESCLTILKVLPMLSYFKEKPNKSDASINLIEDDPALVNPASLNATSEAVKSPISRL